MSYIFGGNTGLRTPEELERRRELARAIMARNMARQPKNLWEGLNTLAGAIGARVEQGRLDKAEAEGTASAGAAFAPLREALAKRQAQSMDAVARAMVHPWASEAQRELAQMLLKRQIEADAPINTFFPEAERPIMTPGGHRAPHRRGQEA
jgi:hypothetical protein